MSNLICGGILSLGFILAIMYPDSETALSIIGLVYLSVALYLIITGIQCFTKKNYTTSEKTEA